MASLAGAQGYSADFESPGYMLGPLEGQDIWIGWDGSTAGITNVVNTQNNTPGGSQSVEIVNGADTVADFDALPGGSFDSGSWNLSIQSFVPTGTLGSNEFLVMNAWDVSGGYEWNAWVTFNGNSGRVEAHTPDGLIFAQIVFDAWIELRFEYDLDNNLVDIFYDGVFVHSYDPRCGTTGGCAAPYSGSFIDAVDLYPDPGTNPTPIYFDDMAVEPGGVLGTAYCFGDGSGTACPCGNSGGSGEGCGNTSGSGGVLDATGSSSVGADDTIFAGHNLLPGQPGLLFFGDNQINGGDGVVFGDGLRCAGTNVVRRGATPPDANGDASWGPGLLAGTSVAAGDTKYWQIWYRDPAGGGSCGNSFNLSNGYAITYGP